MSRLFGWERDDWGMQLSFHGEDDKLIVQHKQDVEPILEANKRQQNGTSSKQWRRYGGNFECIASIPLSIAMKWINEEGVNIITGKRNGEKMTQAELDAFIREKMNGDYSLLKTVPWQV